MSRLSTADLLAEALALHRQGATAEAAARYGAVLESEPGNVDAYYHLGLIACQEGRFAEGAASAQMALAADACHARSHVLLGRAMSALGRRDEAVSSFKQAIALAPDLEQAHSHLADMLSDLGRNAEAIESYDHALLLAPQAAVNWFNRGLALRAEGRVEEALTSFERAIAGKPDFAKAHLERGNTLWELHRAEEALASIETALAMEGGLAEAWHSRGVVLSELKRWNEALASYDRALEQNGDLAEAWLGRGNLLRELKRYEEAVAAHDRALAIKPALAAAWLGRGNASLEIKRFDEASAAYSKVLAIRPEARHVACSRLDVKLQMCDWTNLQAEIAELLATMRDGEPGGAVPRDAGVARMVESTAPMVMARLTDESAILLRSAIECVREQASYPKPFTHVRMRPTGKLRLAYMSQDFRQHVTGMNFVDLFEQHDRSRFELFGLALTADDGSAIRKRIASAFDHFHDLSVIDDEAAARRIRELGIDVIVEMVGHSRESRPAILAHRPAPVQVNGWSAGHSAGAPYIDYVVSDPWMLPSSDQQFFLEKIVHLPNTCFPHDSTQAISPSSPARAEEGLPEDGFVFCCFNGSYKITPEFFAVWMNLLRELPGSVLWLASNNEWATANLRREAGARGIDPGRLVFAQRRLLLADHLARHHLAGLFLDTLPYNAQSTSMDALWAGLPVLTCAGRSYAGRFAMSQLHNIGLSELIAEDIAAYERLAIDLARDPHRLRELRARLERNRLTSPLFDTKRLCRELEAAYETMAEIWQRGESPRSFSVE
jgi:predicted O-linked N-acetylglucosamine transferase (SPINDLY family)